MQPSTRARFTNPPEDGWPVDFIVEGKHHAAHRAIAVGPHTLKFASKVPYPPAWLAELTLHGDVENFTILANVQSCEQGEDGSYLIVARPFGLGGEVDEAWWRLVSRARPQLRAIS